MTRPRKAQSVLPDRGPIGIFILRVWLEGRSPDDLRIRVVSTRDARGGETRSTAISSADDACRMLRHWLEAFGTARDAGDGVTER